MRGVESIVGQVHNPVMELIVTRHDKDALFTVKGMEDIKVCVAAVVVMREVWGI